MTTRPLQLVFFVGLAVLALAGWWCVGASTQAHVAHPQTITVDNE